MEIPDKALETGAHHACFAVWNELLNKDGAIAGGDGGIDGKPQMPRLLFWSHALSLSQNCWAHCLQHPTR